LQRAVFPGDDKEGLPGYVAQSPAKDSRTFFKEILLLRSMEGLFVFSKKVYGGNRKFKF